MCFSAVHNRVSLYLSSVAAQALPSYVWSVKAEVDCTLLLIFREFRRCKGWLWVNKAHCMFPMFVLWWKAPLKFWSSLPVKVGLAWLAKPLGSVEYLHGLRFLGLSGEAHPSQLESVPAGISCASPLCLVSPLFLQTYLPVIQLLTLSCGTSLLSLRWDLPLVFELHEVLVNQFIWKAANFSWFDGACIPTLLKALIRIRFWYGPSNL